MTPLSGTQYTLEAGDYRADIASVGASLRTLTFRGRDLVVPFQADEVRPGSRGVLLAPWPNRVVDGHYSFDGVDYVLPLTEPARQQALHGFALWQEFTPVAQSQTEVTLATVIEPRREYPWRIFLETTFSLTAEGLTQSVRASNLSASAAPFGTGPHPYLVGGTSPLDEWTLELPASDVIEVTPDRLSPVALHAAADLDAERFDWREPRVLGEVKIDHAYTGLTRDADGMATVRVTDASGSGVAMTWDARCPWVQIHTADLPNGRQPNRVGLAVEPMTCAPDAFNDANYPFDTGLQVLQPGASLDAGWTITAI